MTTTRARVVASARPSSRSSRCGITLVNHEPGPSTTTSASRTASTASAHAGAPAGSRRTERTRPGVAAIDDWPRMRRGAVGVVGVEAIGLGDEVERDGAHRQHPADGADQLGDAGERRDRVGDRRARAGR